MPFTSYASVADVARAYRIQCRRAAFVAPLVEHFRAELAFTLSEIPFNRSEAATCEVLIYPLLREV